MGRIDGHTVLTGLLGRPVAHSISPLMHNEAFEQLGLNYVYLCFDAGEEDMEKTVGALKQLGARGWNCTMPDKQAMFRLSDRRSDAADLTGAVNTVVNDNGVLTGHNTDGVGYMMAVKDAGFDIIGKKMTLLGGGGAAAAILAQAALDGVKEISIFCRRGRSFLKMEAMAARLNDRTECAVRLFDIADNAVLKRELSESVILTNATNVGMAPDEEKTLIPDIEMLHKELIVSDIIYNPRQTKLLSMARQAGCPYMNGLYMLLYQGAEAFRLWTGEQMPVSGIKNKFFI